MMLSTHGMMNLSGVMLVHGGAGQASIPVGMEKSGPAPKPGGKSLTWRELELLAQETTPSDQHCRKHVGPAGKSADPAHFFAFSTETNFRSQVSLEEESQNPPSVGHWKPLMPSKGDKEEAESGCQDAGGVHEPQSTEQLNVSRLRSSSVEIREKGSEFLRDELHKAQKELKLKDKECERLSKVREQLEQELEELTASLFEEAHKMVREANTKQAAAEKQLREARGKIDMLQAEVTALKTLVITSTPSSPNRELHPQLQSPSKAGFRKGHGRNKSTSSAMVSAASQSVAPEPVSRECRESGFPALLSLLLCILPGKAIHITYEPGWQALGADASSFSSSSRQVDSILFAEFQAWKESPTLDKSCSFLDRIYREDVGPCLDFTKQELSELVQVAVEQNTLTIEPVASQTVPVGKVAAEECGGPKKCALSGLPRTCKHRIMLGDSGNYYYISPSCRARPHSQYLAKKLGSYLTVLRRMLQAKVVLPEF
ncbi:guanine nucleotide exchange factor for Rab-3A isoform X8 [Passer montanus]|uniref:guanine nucleotide exchange factor for Rab-3A isoform X8 n=1 Tax=Passer montanus TaxID=9160 RepID=UPI0019619D51|nr:guanine nucleotide exchange factor for Rab-3A isoform X8 [Passer montanus]